MRRDGVLKPSRRPAEQRLIQGASGNGNLPRPAQCGDRRAYGRFNEVFLRHDPAALPGMIAEDCVIEKISPAPNGDRCVGRNACVALWTEIATAPGTRFDNEKTFVMGERAIIRWRFWSSDTVSLRSVNLMRVGDGLIVEAMGYIKGA